MNHFETTLSSILQELIRKKGLSISELARRTSIPQPTLYRIAQGEHQRPHKKTLQALSDFFRITVDQLIGLEPIKSVITDKPSVSQIPILNNKQATSWPHIKNIEFNYVFFEKPIGKNAFALIMPDRSMEPLIAINTLLIIDPERKPEYRSLVVVKLHNFGEVVVRQLIQDAANQYIRPLSQDFDHFEMIMLTSEDCIIGTVVEARLTCEGL
jgi:SOS-response transcriptional repressor LexA